MVGSLLFPRFFFRVPLFMVICRVVGSGYTSEIGRSVSSGSRETAVCTLAILYKVARNTPILLAANREENFSRPTQYPKIQAGTPRIVCGIDRQAGGPGWASTSSGSSWPSPIARSRFCPTSCASRGLLCRDLLDRRNARDAVEYAVKELSTGAYAGANYVCADGKFAAVVYGGNRVEVVELTPGLHTLTNGNLDDLQDERHEFIRRMLTLHTLDSAVTFLAVASRAFSRKPDAEGRRGVALSGGQYGTVSSTLLALSRKPQHSIYQYAPGPPCDCAYDDLSALLRQVLSAGRAQRRRRSMARSPATKRRKSRPRRSGRGEEETSWRDGRGAKEPLSSFLPPEKVVLCMSREFPNCLLGSMSDECHQLEKEGGGESHEHWQTDYRGH